MGDEETNTQSGWGDTAQHDKTHKSPQKPTKGLGVQAGTLFTHLAALLREPRAKKGRNDGIGGFTPKDVDEGQGQPRQSLVGFPPLLPSKNYSRKRSDGRLVVAAQTMVTQEQLLATRHRHQEAVILRGPQRQHLLIHTCECLTTAQTQPFSAPGIKTLGGGCANRRTSSPERRGNKERKDWVKEVRLLSTPDSTHPKHNSSQHQASGARGLSPVCPYNAGRSALPSGNDRGTAGPTMPKEGKKKSQQHFFQNYFNGPE
ncbi:hypothetical protein C0Q70_04298 [Pomacea canaliculata]|uniref:Uncharacterized protein n=1 Tax=Pomacea canaliculata TaxID=400727 RepID=A0A2T7PV51_POMCA|nr:hypothetical protein C0Q70_04298 [Pomacea canaliculata]